MSRTTGAVMNGNDLGTSTMSRTCATSRPKKANNPATADPANTATTRPSGPNLVRWSRTINATVTSPTVSVGTSTFQKLSRRSRARAEPTPSLRVVAGEVVQLAEHDVDADGRDESGHHRVRHESQERPEPEQPREDHHESGQDRQCVQRSGRVVTRREVDVGHDDGHGSGALNCHERGAGEQCTAGQTEHVAVQPCDRVHAGQKAARQTVGNTLDAQDEAGHRIVFERLALDQRRGTQNRELHDASSTTRRPTPSVKVAVIRSSSNTGRPFRCDRPVRAHVHVATLRLVRPDPVRPISPV